MEIITATEMKELDRRTIESGTGSSELMERAGMGFVRILERELGNLKRRKILIFAGKGNNGGDGLVVARQLKKMGCRVTVVLLAEKRDMTGDCLLNFRRAKKLSVKFMNGLTCPPHALCEEISGAAVIVDAIFGTGFQGDMKGTLRAVTAMINDSPKPVVSCDIPSGVNGDTGAVGTGGAVRADLTITFAYPKRGLFSPPGNAFAGNIRVADIGIRKTEEKGKTARLCLLTNDGIKCLLMKRKKNVYKNNFGHILVLAGSPGMTGAATLVCEAAARSGAGLVTLAIPESLNGILATKLTEAMTLPLEETGAQTLSLRSFESIVKFVKKRKVSAVAMGPGFSSNPETASLVRKLVSALELPCVLDADALNAFVSCLAELKRAGKRLIITPHEGEFSRLSGIAKSVIEKDRINRAKSFASENGLVCVLKGYQTVVSDGKNTFINTTGNPGMATGGAGDVLTG